MTPELSLRARVEVLEDQLRTLLAALTGPRAVTIRPFGLTPQQMLLCAGLARSGFASIEVLEGLLPMTTQTRDASAPTMVLRSQISKIRRALGGTGVEIVNARGEGYHVISGLDELRAIVGRAPTSDVSGPSTAVGRQGA